MVSVSVQDRCTVCAKCTIGSEIVFDAPDGTQVTWVIWNLISVFLEAMLVSGQDRCTVCAKCTISSEIILDAPDHTPR
jgi:ferredoxin